MPQGLKFSPVFIRAGGLPAFPDFTNGKEPTVTPTSFGRQPESVRKIQTSLSRFIPLNTEL